MILGAGLLGAMFLPFGQMHGAPISTTPYHPNGIVASPDGATLYIAASSAGTSFFLAANTQFGTITAALPLLNQNTGTVEQGAFQVAINPNGTLIFVLNTLTSSVDVIDQATNTQIATFSSPTIQAFPSGIRVSPNGEQLWVANSATAPGFENGTVSVIGLKSANFGVPLNLINTGGNPNQILFNEKGTHAYVLNTGFTGFVDEINAKTYRIITSDLASDSLDSPNPLAMDLLANETGLYIGNGTSYVNHVIIKTGFVEDIIYMFPGLAPEVQDIGQVLISPDQKYVVTANIDTGSSSVAKTSTNEFAGYIYGAPGSHIYFLAFHQHTLYASYYNGTGVGTPGGLDFIGEATLP